VPFSCKWRGHGWLWRKEPTPVRIVIKVRRTRSS